MIIFIAIVFIGCGVSMLVRQAVRVRSSLDRRVRPDPRPASRPVRRAARRPARRAATRPVRPPAPLHDPQPPSGQSAWTALDDAQLIRLLKDSA